MGWTTGVLDIQHGRRYVVTDLSSQLTQLEVDMAESTWVAPPPMFVSGMVIGIADAALIVHFMAEYPVVTGDTPPDLKLERPRVASVGLTPKTASELIAELTKAVEVLKRRAEES